ncbi:MAG: hypothetical protein MPF33_10895 [Candidatus Aramenus sp.]|nr:hypothetical protein [Candidatus Aramenus sp.]
MHFLDVGKVFTITQLHIVTSSGISVSRFYLYVIFGNTEILLDPSKGLEVARVSPKGERVRTPTEAGEAEWRPAFLKELSTGYKIYLHLPFPHYPFKMICSDGMCFEEPRNAEWITHDRLVAPGGRVSMREGGILEVINPSMESWTALKIKGVWELMSIPPNHALYVMPNTCWVNRKDKKTYCYY